jgi:hypothetical protein
MSGDAVRFVAVAVSKQAAADNRNLKLEGKVRCLGLIIKKYLEKLNFSRISIKIYILISTALLSITQ